MKNLLIALIMFFALNANGQWVQQYFGGNYKFFNNIQFVNNGTGYIVCEKSGMENGSVFLKTTNGGINWVNINMNFSPDFSLFSLSFVNVNTGYACGRSNYIRKTTNAGINWFTYNAPSYSNQNYNAISFLNEQTGYIGGRYGMRAKTTNGGINWVLFDTAYAAIDALYFFDVNTGFMTDAMSGIYSTTNGGLNWSYRIQTDTNGVGYDFCSISFTNDSTGYMLGATYYSAVIMKTTNKGIDWRVVNTYPSEMASVFALKNSNYVYVGGSLPYVSYSTDAGKTWRNTQNIPSPAEIYGIYFLDPNTGYSCGTSAEVFRTTNGGVGIHNISTETPSSFSLSQNYPNPFNPVTKIKFSIPNHSNVKLEIYDVSGKLVQLLVDEKLHVGTYEAYWDASSMPSGTYFCRMTNEKFTKTIKLILLK